MKQKEYVFIDDQNTVQIFNVISIENEKKKQNKKKTLKQMS